MTKKEYAYCQCCDDDVEFEVTEKNRKTKVRGVDVVCTYFEARCKNCHELVYPVSISKQNDILLFDAYKKAEGLLTSEQLIEIRSNLGLSQTEMAKKLNIGAKNIARYENGSIQTRNIDNAIRRLSAQQYNYEEMLKIITKYFDNQAIFYTKVDTTSFYLISTHKDNPVQFAKKGRHLKYGLTNA